MGIASLFSGVGAIEHGLSAHLKLPVLLVCEINEDAQRVLARQFPGVPLHPDIRTLRTLMTPALPPFYRIFMGGVVPSHDPADARVGADPKWLADAFAAVREKLPEPLAKHLAPGNQLGPWFYAPALTAVVSPYAFGFLVGPATLNRRSDGQIGGLVVEKCKFLQESNCKGMCLNSCKLPAQALFGELVASEAKAHVARGQQRGPVVRVRQPV